MEEILKEAVVFGVWSRKCGECANYSGCVDSQGLCRVWGTLIASASSLPGQCPHWTSREAVAVSGPGTSLGS